MCGFAETHIAAHADLLMCLSLIRLLAAGTPASARCSTFEGVTFGATDGAKHWGQHHMVAWLLAGISAGSSMLVLRGDSGQLL